MMNEDGGALFLHHSSFSERHLSIRFPPTQCTRQVVRSPWSVAKIQRTKFQEPRTKFQKTTLPGIYCREFTILSLATDYGPQTTAFTGSWNLLLDATDYGPRTTDFGCFFRFFLDRLTRQVVT